MKKLLVLSLVLWPSITFSQKIEENKIDEFTKSNVLRTSWEKLVYSMKGTIFFRVSKIDNNTYLGIKMMLPGRSGRGDIFSISKDAELMLHLKTDEVVRIKNTEYATSGIGEGAKGFAGSSAWGIHANYTLPEDDRSKLADRAIDKIRVYTNDGYVEFEISEKKSTLINPAMALVK